MSTPGKSPLAGRRDDVEPVGSNPKRRCLHSEYSEQASHTAAANRVQLRPATAATDSRRRTESICEITMAILKTEITEPDSINYVLVPHEDEVPLPISDQARARLKRKREEENQEVGLRTSATTSIQTEVDTLKMTLERQLGDLITRTDLSAFRTPSGGIDFAIMRQEVPEVVAQKLEQVCETEAELYELINSRQLPAEELYLKFPLEAIQVDFGAN